MNIDKLEDEAKTDDTAVAVPLKNREGEPYRGKNGKPTVWYIVGEYSKQFIDAERKRTDRIIKQARRGRVDFDADDAEQAAIDKICDATSAPFWENVEDKSGTPVPYNRANAAVVLKRAPWIAPQLERAIKGHADFFAQASKS
jgi:hypothetical protein